MIRALTANLIALIIFTHASIADFKVLSFTSYGAEVKRDGYTEWEFVKRGDILTAADSLRIPPDVVIRVEDNNNQLIMLPRSQEASIDALVKEANQGKATWTGDPNALIPTRWKDSPKKKNTASSSSTESPSQSFNLGHLTQIATIDEVTLEEILADEETPPYGEYPYRNLGYAKRIFKKLHKVIKLVENENIITATPRTPQEVWKTKTATQIEFAVLYLALLKGKGIEARFEQKLGKLFLFFNSGKHLEQMNEITINQKIYRKAQLHAPKQTQLPLLLYPLDSNFVRSWYFGGYNF